MKNKRILIITGGSLSIDFAREYVNNQKYDTIIAVDSGLAYAENLNLNLQYLVGDFDSVPKEVLDKYYRMAEVNGSPIIKKFNPEKDLTDTQIAIELAISLEANELTILGATGTRIDHLLANIQLLSLTRKKNIDAFIIDEHNKLYLLDHSTTIKKENLFGPFISLLPYTEVVKEVTLKGFKYPLFKRDIHIGASLGISNEVTAEQADIIFQSGMLIVTESKD